MSRRTQRLNVQFREEVSDLILNHLRDPRLASLISVTRVDVSPDLENADVFISVMGEPEEKASSMQALAHAEPFLRREMLHRMSIRRIPHLKFHLDESIEEAARVLDLMRQVEQRETDEPL
jgi:ribosome-binding factor A